MIIQTEAIVIRSTKYSDSDCILTLFTRKMGKLGVYSKNARLMKSPLMSGSQNIEFLQNRRQRRKDLSWLLYARAG